jgi:predicted AAA+ superfamily ATPase
MDIRLLKVSDGATWRQVAKSYQNVLDFEGLEGASSREQRKHFRNTLYQHTRREEHRIAAPKDWADMLTLLFEHVRTISAERCIIFFDELQWMAAGRSELVSKLKLVWDRYCDQVRTHLVLCGSVSSFLVRKVIRSKALYGRIDQFIDLGPLRFPEVRAGFFHGRSIAEALEYYLVFGGIPTYLELYDQDLSTRLNILDLCFKPGSFFVDELDRLFASHFGSKPEYRRIVKGLARTGPASRPQIARTLGKKSGGHLNGLIEDLCLAGFVEAYNPVHRPNSSHLKRYRINDPFLSFHFRFIEPQARRIGRSDDGLQLAVALPDKRYEVFLGLAFERFCYQHAHLLAKKLGFSAVAYDFGSWFQKRDMTDGAQIDLLFKRADRVLTLCEVKHREKVGLGVISEVEKKVERLRESTNDTIEKVLISARPPSRNVLKAGYFSKVLTIDDFL